MPLFRRPALAPSLLSIAAAFVPLPTYAAGRPVLTCRSGLRTARVALLELDSVAQVPVAQSTAAPGSGEPSEATELEGPPPYPPFRSWDLAGYRAPEHLRTWTPFTYATPLARREAVREWVRTEHRAAERPMHVVLLGGPSCGKGTIAPMLSQAFRLRVVGAGQVRLASL